MSVALILSSFNQESSGYALRKIIRTDVQNRWETRQCLMVKYSSENPASGATFFLVRFVVYIRRKQTIHRPRNKQVQWPSQPSTNS